LSCSACSWGALRYLSATQGREIIQAIEALPDQITHILRQSEQIRTIAEKYRAAKSMLYFGGKCNTAWRSRAR